MKMLVFFLAKCVRNAVKTMVVDRKKQKALALLYLTSKLMRKAANSRRIACVASVSVGLSARSRRFSLFGCTKIGASATLMEAVFARPKKRKVL